MGAVVVVVVVVILDRLRVVLGKGRREDVSVWGKDGVLVGCDWLLHLQVFFLLHNRHS